MALRNVDTESEWSKSGYRGWAQGYRLLLQGLAFPYPVPIFAAWRPNNEYEVNEAGGWVLTSKQLPPERRSWKDDLFAYRKETIELLFQRIMQAAGLTAMSSEGQRAQWGFRSGQRLGLSDLLPRRLPGRQADRTYQRSS